VAECFQLHPALLIDQVAALMLLVLVAVLVWVSRNYRFHGKGFFLASVVGAGFWLAAITLEHRAMGENCKVFWAQTAWLGIGLLPTALCFFIDDYARARDHWHRKTHQLLLIGGPVAIFGMAATNRWHGQFYGPATQLNPVGPAGQVIYDHGPLFYLAAAWLYLFVIAGVAVLLRGLFGAHPAHRSFFLSWLLVVILPIVTNLGYVFNGLTIAGLDPTAYAYALTMMVLSFFIITDRMLDLRAVALEVLWRNTPSPILVVMPDGRVASANPAALALCGQSRAEGHLKEWEPLAPLAARLTAPDLSPGEQILAFGTQRFEPRILSIETPLDRREEMGRLLWLNDITLRHELEGRLAAERDYLQLLMQTTMTGIVALDAGGRVVFANAEVSRLTGQCVSEIVGLDHAVLFPPVKDEAERETTSFTTAIESAISQRAVHVGFRRTDGAARILSVNIARLHSSGVEARVVCALADITEELERESALEAARERAESANRTKSQFLANMSHEIRTPLNGVLGMAELLEAALEDQKMREMARTIRDSGATLLSVLNDVLDMSKIEAGKMQIEAKPFSPTEITERITALHLTTAEEKGLDFCVLSPGDKVPARMGDLHRILQVLHNLVSNAIKFTIEGSVTVKLQGAAGEPLLFEVRDTGIGMTDKQAARIFNEFEQGDGSVARRFGGTGLGLAIAKRLVEQMQGEIALETELGRGTCVSVRLPLAECKTPLIVGEQTEPHTISEQVHRPSTEDQPLAGFSFIAADDSAVNRTLLGMMLKRAGASVHMCDGGQLVLAEWRPRTFDIVLLDISMPDLDGISTLAALRSTAEELGAEPPVALAITANVMTHQIAEYRAAGFAGHVGKPFQSAQLVAEILRVAKK